MKNNKFILFLIFLVINLFYFNKQVSCSDEPEVFVSSIVIKDLEELPIGMSDQVGFYINSNELAFIGGINSSNLVTSDAMIYNLDSEKYSSIAQPEIGRYRFCGVLLHGEIFIAGGRINFETDQATSSVEKYSIDDDEWETIVELPQARSDHACFIYDNQFCVAGGYNSDYTNVLNDILCLNDDEDEWVDSKLPPLNTGRGDFSIVNLNGDLYAIGGFDSSFNLIDDHSVEKYDSDTNEWNYIEPLIKPRGDAAIHQLRNEFIVVIGGQDTTGSTPVDDIEIYSTQTKEWSEFSKNIDPIDRFRMASASNNKNEIFIFGGHNSLEDELKNSEQFNFEFDSDDDGSSTMIQISFVLISILSFFITLLF